MKQIQVPQQDEGENCGYRMLSNLSKVIKGKGYGWKGIKNATDCIVI